MPKSKRFVGVTSKGYRWINLGEKTRYFFFGTFFPFFLALDRPIAIACFRLFTLPPFPPFPDLAVPFLYRCISRFTSLPAPLEYFRFLLRFAMIFSVFNALLF